MFGPPLPNEVANVPRLRTRSGGCRLRFRRKCRRARRKGHLAVTIRFDVPAEFGQGGAPCRSWSAGLTPMREASLRQIARDFVPVCETVQDYLSVLPLQISDSATGDLDPKEL